MDEGEETMMTFPKLSIVLIALLTSRSVMARDSERSHGSGFKDGGYAEKAHVGGKRSETFRRPS